MTAKSSPEGPPRVALIIPTLNEAASIGRVVAEVPRKVVDRILVADSGSTDGTGDVATEAGAEVIAAGRGYGRACLAAAEAAVDAEILVFMDGDGADDPSAIERFVAPVATREAELVIGSRVRGVAEPGSMFWHQRLAGRLLGGLIGALYGVRFTDMCAFRAIRRDRLLALGMTEMTYGWNLEMQMRVARAGWRVHEIPVDNRNRIGGESKVAGSLRGSLSAGSRILGAFVRLAVAPNSTSALVERA